MDTKIKRLFETAVHIAFIPRYLALTTLAEAKKPIFEKAPLVSSEILANADKMMVKRLEATCRIYTEVLTQMQGKIGLDTFKTLARRIYSEEGVPVEILRVTLPILGKIPDDLFLEICYKELSQKSDLIIALSRAIANVQSTCSDRITPNNYSVYSREILEITGYPGVREEQERECLEQSIAVSAFFATTLMGTAFSLEDDGEAFSAIVVETTLKRYRALWA